MPPPLSEPLTGPTFMLLLYHKTLRIAILRFPVEWRSCSCSLSRLFSFAREGFDAERRRLAAIVFDESVAGERGALTFA